MKYRELVEEFLDYAETGGNEFFAIYRNPSEYDYGEMKKEINSNHFGKTSAEKEGYRFRFLIDVDKKNVYAFSALALHVDAIGRIKKSLSSNIIKGAGIIGKPDFLYVKTVGNPPIPDWARKYL